MRSGWNASRYNVHGQLAVNDTSVCSFKDKVIEEKMFKIFSKVGLLSEIFG